MAKNKIHFMYKIKFIFLIILIQFFSCKPYKYSAVKPQPIESSNKILGLIPITDREYLLEQYSTTTFLKKYSDDVFELHEDAVNGVFNDKSGDKYGYGTFRINHLRSAYNTGAGGLVLTTLILPLLGVPIGSHITDLDLDYYIYDSRKNLIAKYNAKIENCKGRIGAYFNYSTENSARISHNKAFKMAFEQIGELISKDSEAINAKLKRGEKLTVEKSDIIGNTKEISIKLDPSRTPDTEKKGGTGFLISENGYVVTNYHVVEDASKIELLFPTDTSVVKYNASVISSDKTNDIAILKIDDSKFVSPGNIPFNITDDYNIGEKVYTIGYPQPDIMGTSYKYTSGEINSLSGMENDITLMQITTPIQPGNSGGPLFNQDGNVVGITTSTLNPFYTAKYSGTIPQNVNYAVKSDYLKPLIKQYFKKPENSLTGKSQSEQIKMLGKFTCLIKVF